MVLAGNVAFPSSEIQGWDIVCSVAVLELDGPGSGGQSQQLMTKTDTKDWYLRSLHQLSKVIDGVLAMSRITWAVGDKHAIEMVSNLVNRVVEREAGGASSSAD